MVYLAYVDSSVPAEDGRKGVVAAQNVTGTKFISDSKWSYAAFDQTTSKPYFSASSVSRVGRVGRACSGHAQLELCLAARRQVAPRPMQAVQLPQAYLPALLFHLCPPLPAARGPLPGHPPHHRGAAPVVRRRSQQLPRQRDAPISPGWEVASGRHRRLWRQQPRLVRLVCAGCIHKPGLHIGAHPNPVGGIPGEYGSSAL